MTLDCEPETLWAALRKPSVFAQVSAPWVTPVSREPGGFPDEWPEGVHEMDLKFFGVIPFGRQRVNIAYRNNSETGVAVARDTGGAVSGPLALARNWDHRMAVSAAPDGRALFRDQLRFSAGALGPAMWPFVWLMWQWRARQLRRLARDW